MTQLLALKKKKKNNGPIQTFLCSVKCAFKSEVANTVFYHNSHTPSTHTYTFVEIKGLFLFTNSS